MSNIRPFLSKLSQSAVVWSWFFNGLRLSSALLLLPLLTRSLGEEDLGFHFVLLSLVSFVPFLDVGFLPAISRSITFAMGGTRDLQAQGIASVDSNLGAPNFQLLWKLLYTTRALYRCLAAGALVILCAWGTFVAGMKIHETSHPNLSWIAWWLTLAGTVFEVYSSWWNAYLRGTNHVLLSVKTAAVAYLLRLATASGLLLAGAGLLSVPIATLVYSMLQRSISRRFTLKFLSAHPAPPPSRAEILQTLGVLWPNSWRVGVHCLSNFLAPHFNTIACVHLLGLAANAQYGLSLQIMGILQGMSAVWIQVKWPLIGQYFARHDLVTLRRLFHVRLLLVSGSFVVMAVMAIPLASWLLELLKTGKSTLPLEWMIVLAISAYADLHQSTWATMVSMSNRLPFLAITVGTNVASVIITVILLNFTSLGLGALVLGPLLANAVHNHWRWPQEGARMLGATWLKFMCGGWRSS